MDRRCCLVPLAFALGACSGLAPPSTKSAPSGTPPPDADARAAAPSALAAERQWLQSWFEGTPVRIEQERSGPVTIDVPQRYCFEDGRSEIKPPLGAVLDKLAESLRRMPVARLTRLAAPGDAGRSALALQRGEQVRRHLMARGVPGEQLAPPSVSDAPAVQLRLALAPA